MLELFKFENIQSSACSCSRWPFWKFQLNAWYDYFIIHSELRFSEKRYIQRIKQKSLKNVWKIVKTTFLCDVLMKTGLLVGFDIVIDYYFQSSCLRDKRTRDDDDMRYKLYHSRTLVVINLVRRFSSVKSPEQTNQELLRMRCKVERERINYLYKNTKSKDKVIGCTTYRHAWRVEDYVGVEFFIFRSLY